MSDVVAPEDMTRATKSTRRQLRRWWRSGTPRRLRSVGLAALMIGGMSTVASVASPAGLVQAEDNIVITTDVDGPDDVPAQTDVSLLGFDDSHLPDYYVAQMQFDDTAYPGGNSGDGCIFFDSDDAEGFTDFAVCGSFIQNTTTGVVELQSAALYDCKGSEPNNDEGKRCGFIGGGGDGSNGIIAQDLNGDGVFESDGDGNPLGTPYDTTCSLNTTASDPFDGVGTHNTSGEQDPILDTQLTCLIYADELVELDGDEPTGIVVSNACSFTSPDPSSESKDCIVDPGSGFLQIVKNTTGGDDTFDYTVDGALFASITTTGGTGSTVFIPLDARDGVTLAEVVPTGWQLDSASCDNGDDPSALVIEGAQSVVCTFNNSVAIVAPDITVDKTADPVSVAEPGGNVTFTVVVTNNATADLGDATLDSLVDDIHGDLNGQGDCSVPQPLPGGGGTYTCSFTASVTGDPGDTEIDTVTATASNSGGSDTASDDATVTITDVPATMNVVKTASPTTVDEPGGNVTFSFVVNNTSSIDSITIDTLNDSIYGDLNSQGDCAVPQTIAAGGSYSCAITVFVSGNAGGSETNVVTASGQDDDGNPVTDDDDETVTINDIPSSIEVVKTANPETVDEPGGNVTFSFVVNNTSVADEVTIDSLTDSIYGDLDGQGDCSVPQTITAGGSYSCAITANVSGNAGDAHTNVATASGTDDDGEPVSDDDDATVTIGDVPSAIEILKTADPTTVDEPGGDVTFSFVVNNLSAVDEVTIDSLTDTVYGDLNGQGDCSVPQTITAGGSYSCAITANVSGNAGDTHTNVATASGTDDDGEPVSDDDDATVTINDLPSAIEILKTADPTTVDEPGGDVTFSFVVNNVSAGDAVTIDSLTDTVYGDLNGQGDCTVPQTLAIGGSYSCAITANVSGNAGDTHTNVATASGTDDDGNPVTDDDDATVTLNNVQSAIEVTKTANPTSVSEPGDDVTFTFLVENLSTVDTVTLNSLTDTIYGDLNGQGDCSVPQTIAPNGSYSCSFTTLVSGDAGDTHTNVATAAGVDDDGDPVSDDDDATVTVEDVPSAIEILKTADPISVSELGGDVTFTFVVNNLSAADAVTIDTLDDSIYGDLNGQGDCQVPQTLGVGGSYSCSITVPVSGNADDVITNVATASGLDDDGQPVADDDDALVTITDIPSSIDVVKMASPGSVDEPGGDVTFTFTVINTSLTDEVTINSLTDTIYGDLNGQGDCVVPQTLAVDGSYDCSITVFVGGNAFDTHTNVATAAGVDDDGNPVSDFDDETVTITDVPSSIKTTKTANPTSVPETGGDVTFTIVVENTSTVDAVTINTVTDTVFGDVSASCAPALPATLAPGETVTCTFTEFLFGDAGTSHVNVATGSGEDDDGNPVEDDDDETVPFEDVLPDISIVKTADPTSVPETGGDVTFTFLVTNNSLEAATLDSLVDSDFGDLNGQGDCAVPQNLAGNGGTYNCAITVFLSGDASGPAHNNVVTATASDDDGNPVEDDDDETVPFEDVLPDISIVKTADPTSVPETGGDVTFTFLVTNNSLEAATLDSLVDSDFGDLNGQGDCAVPQNLAGNGGTYNCAITVFLSGDASGPAHNNVVTATASDDDGNPVEDDDDETVPFEDVLPDISIVKTANPTSVFEPGGDVTFTFLVTNESLEDATLDSLIDTDFGDLNGQGTCTVPQALAGNGGTYTCEITVFIAGNAGDDHNNLATATASDNDGNSDTASDDADVTLENAAPAVSVLKDGPATIDEGGATATYPITITNDSVSTDPLTITSLNDDKFGDLLPEAEAANGGPIVLQPGDSFDFSINRPLTLNVGDTHTNVVTVIGEDDEGTTATDNDDHTVGATDVAPAVSIIKGGPPSIDEGGDTATYDITVTNDSVSTDPLTITSLNDDKFGDLLPEAEAANGGPIILNPGESFSFQISRSLEFNVGDIHTNVVTVVGEDDEGSTATDNDDHDVTFDNVDPAVSIVKDGPATIDEGGATATYPITITNDSVSTDPLTITSLNDDKFGDLLPEAEAANGGPIVLQPGDSFDFSINRPLTLNVGDTHTNVVTVIGEDDEGTTATDNDDHTVGASNVDPVITVDKTAGQLQVFAPGEDVIFTVVIENDSVSTDPVTIDSLLDSIHGDLNGQGDCSVPQTIQPGGSYDCSFTVLVDGDETDVITASGTDDEGTSVSESDDATVDMINPAISIEKSTGPQDADTPPGPEILVGETVNWFYQVTNIGDVPLSNLVVTDDQGVDVICGTTILPAGASSVCEASGISVADQYANLGTASASHTDVDGDTANRSDNDPSHYFGASPSVDIVKTFTDDSVTAGGAASSFTLVVTNDGNVALQNVSVADDVDGRLAVTGVSGTAGSDADSDGDPQTVEWLIGTLAVGQSVTITVDVSVDAAEPEANGAGGPNDAPTVTNTAIVSDTYWDTLGNSIDIGDLSTDTIDIVTEIELAIAKGFYRIDDMGTATTNDDVRVEDGKVEQGTIGFFELTVTNAGPSYARDVQVSDAVNGLLEVVAVTVTQASTAGGETCDSASQTISCTIPTLDLDDQVIITVQYRAAEFLDPAAGPIYGTSEGDEFRFVFLNGYVVEGSSDTDGAATLIVTAPDGFEQTLPYDGTKNEVDFDPSLILDAGGDQVFPGDGVFTIHLSCSDPFTGGWGSGGGTNGPIEGVDVNWQIGTYSILRYNQNGFFKGCGDVVNPVDVSNTGFADGADSDSEIGTDEQVSDPTSVQIIRQLKIEIRNEPVIKGKKLDVLLFNTGEDVLTITEVELEWTANNGDLVEVRFGGNNTIYDGPGLGSPASITSFVPGSDLTIDPGEGLKLGYFFQRKAKSGTYAITVTLEGGLTTEVLSITRDL